MSKSMALGGGGRFAKLAASKGARLAAWIGRRKYGSKGMAALSHRGTSGAPAARAAMMRLRGKKGR